MEGAVEAAVADDPLRTLKRQPVQPRSSWNFAKPPQIL
jgi:hypothetical protein